MACGPFWLAASLSVGLISCGAIIDAGDHHARPDAEVLADQQHVPTAVAVDSDAAYWINQARPGASDGAVLKVSKIPGSPPLVLAGGLAQPVWLALDESDIYFTDGSRGGEQGRGGLYRVAKIGGAATRIDTDALAAFGMVALGADHAYTEAPVDIVNAKRIRKSSKQGRLIEPTCDVGVSDYTPKVWLGPLTVDSEAVYLAHSILGVIRLTTTCTTGKGLSLRLAGEKAQGIAVDESDLFLITANGSLRQFDKRVIAPGRTVMVGHEDANARHTLTLSKDDVYIAALDAGEITMVAKSGATEPRRLAQAQGQPSSIAVDSEGVVYWTNRKTGEVMRLDPR